MDPPSEAMGHVPYCEFLLGPDQRVSQVVRRPGHILLAKLCGLP